MRVDLNIRKLRLTTRVDVGLVTPRLGVVEYASRDGAEVLTLLGGLEDFEALRDALDGMLQAEAADALADEVAAR